jgi:hypothetical protein
MESFLIVHWVGLGPAQIKMVGPGPAQSKKI